MKGSVIRLALFAASLVLVLSGCALKPFKVTPVAPAHLTASSVRVVDARKVSTSQTDEATFGYVIRSRGTKPIPENGWNLGHADGRTFTYNGDRDFLSVIGSIVGERFPQATVTVRDLRLKTGGGLWMSDAFAFITADIESSSGKITISATGKNVWSQMTDRNFAIAYERALQDFYTQVSAARSALSSSP